MDHTFCKGLAGYGQRSRTASERDTARTKLPILDVIPPPGYFVTSDERCGRYLVSEAEPTGQDESGANANGHIRNAFFAAMFAIFNVWPEGQRGQEEEEDRDKKKQRESKWEKELEAVDRAISRLLDKRALIGQRLTFKFEKRGILVSRLAWLRGD